MWDARPGPSVVDLRGHKYAVNGVAFSPDSTRVVTGSEDQTARVWDARTGTLLLELRGHAYAVNSVAFSPDGMRIATSAGMSGKQSDVRVWDSRRGSPLIQLRPHSDLREAVAFSRDGTRIVTSDDVRMDRAWDAGTGQELKGEPIPTLQPTGHLSPDGRWFANVIGNRVELIPTQPNEEELAYRRLVMQPNFRLYREAYDAANKANDAFAAKFYLNLFPPTERALIRAEPIVARLFEHLLIRDYVVAALRAQPVADPEVQAACLKLAGTWPESADQCGNSGWSLVRDPGRPEADYQRGLRLAKAACRLEPKTSLTSIPWA